MSNDAIRFLKWLRPGGPWLLTAIIPDGETTTATCRNEMEVSDFVAEHDGKRNIYYTVNPTKRAMSKKPEKGDIAAAEFIHGDLDPEGNETPEQAKERIFKAIEATGLPKPSADIDSGNGIQLLWKLGEQLKPATAVEPYNKMILRAFGAGGGTWNVDRLLRLPGTTNLPNKKKLKNGRVVCSSSILWMNGETYSLSDFPNGETEHETKGAEIPDGELPKVDVDKLPIGDELKKLIKEGDVDGEFKSRSEAVFHVCCSLIRCGIADEVILAVIIDEGLHISDHVHAQNAPRRTARRVLDAALKVQPRPAVVSVTDHVARARAVRDARRPHLLHHRDDFVDWEGGAYRIIADGTMSAEVWDFLDNAVARHGKGKELTTAPFRPNRWSVGETIAALKAVSHLEPRVEPPCWLDGNGPPPRELVAFPNGLLNLRSGKLIQPDPAFFTFAVIGFDYEPKGAEPIAWTTFLNEIFDGEQDQINALQEVFGYLITGDVSMEKAFALIGPKRSGKGTILRVLRSLLALLAVADPSLRFIGTNFGLASLIGKQVAIIDDLRVGSRSDQDVMVENILKITGRGRFTLDRKFKEPWSGILPVKLVLVSNVMPKLGDESAAVASRFIIFNTRTSFYGREDPHLFEDKLEPERVGILHWALDGLRRMRKRGRLIEPKVSVELQDKMANLGSDARAFIAERCVVEINATVEKDYLFEQWRGWCGNNDIRPGTKEKFSANLYAATDGKVHSEKPRDAGGKRRVPTFVGIRMRRPDEEDPM